MGRIVDFHLTKKGIYRAAVKEIEEMYRLSKGGEDPIIDDASRDMFEGGEIDEVKWLNWERFCLKVLNNMGEQAEKE